MEDLAVDAIVEIKKKTCAEYKKLIQQLNSGHQPTDYQMILHKIAFIQSVNELDNINLLFEHLMAP